MDYFAEDKADKLNRLLGLRIMNNLGMIAWQADGYGGASQKLRMLHPLSWPWTVAVVLFAIVAHGVIEVWKELKTLWRDQCVWW
jgi:hypothetical protein